ncbi:hypothetical protein [Dysgonomonas sp. ZJ279]|uniref:hypothetical protein n=1 Tax=Dysgonomonas sp. ZJ279 TaxID=2709796 RepID=UPI0013E9A774|nr:hypothetical protein [Dysgonomonas sp. ZJ279]
MKKHESDRLRSLFHEINSTEPSIDFEDRLMQQIQMVAEKQKSERSVRTKIVMLLSVVAGVVGIFGIPALIFYILGWSPNSDLQMLKSDLNFGFSSLNFSSSIISVSCIALALLIGDTLIRKHLWNKEHKHQ